MQQPKAMSRPLDPLPLVSQQSLSYEDIKPLDLLRITSSTFVKLLLSDDRNDPRKMSVDDNAPTAQDVLLGKTKEPLNHVGNKRFRAIVAMHCVEYQSCTTRVDKTRITTGIISDIHEGGGRFLEKNDVTGQYEEVSEKRAHEKVSHALRQKDPARKKGPRKKKKDCAKASYATRKQGL